MPTCPTSQTATPRDPRLQRPATGVRQQGLTLVELMVGLVLGLVMSTALLLLFANASASSRDLARSAAQIENGRFVAGLLSEDLRMAGFFGELAAAGAVRSDPDPCATTPSGWSTAPLTVPAPIRGYAASDVVACLANRKAGSDAIVVRRLASVPVPVASLSSGSNRFYVQHSFCIDDPANTPFIFGSQPGNFTLRSRGCLSENTVREHVSRIYYLATCNRCGTGGDTTPTLKRIDLVGNQLVTTALADGVEELRLEYGFDTDGNGGADVYLTAPGASGATASWENVMTVKVHFITRSFEREPLLAAAGAQRFQLGDAATIEPAADGFARRAYSFSVRLVNPSGAREVQ